MHIWIAIREASYSFGPRLICIFLMLVEVIYYLITSSPWNSSAKTILKCYLNEVMKNHKKLYGVFIQ
jgi:hypothetical protein